MKAILFVDDHEVLARLSCEILQMQGYRAEYAYNANDALAKFDREKFDIVVTDYRMEGMNGVELARRLRQRAPEIPVVIVTGYGPEEGCDEVNAWLKNRTCSLHCWTRSSSWWARASRRRSKALNRPAHLAGT